MITYSPRDILSLPIDQDDVEAATIGEYLAELLHALWAEGEGFSGKRPLGNSGWERNLYDALARAEAIECTWVGEGDDRELLTHDQKAADELIHSAIGAIAEPSRLPILRADPARAGGPESGIYVRAMRDGHWDSVDIAQLDTASLDAWLSRGDDQFRVKVVRILLGHS
jgi:hypothetical protein